MKLDTAGQALTMLDSALGPLPLHLEGFLRSNRDARIVGFNIQPGQRKAIRFHGMSAPYGFVKHSAVHGVWIALELPGGDRVSMGATWTERTATEAP